MVMSNNQRLMNKDAHNDVRAKIIQAAEERLWHFGFKKTTIDEIAADAGVGKGTIYLHFSSKEDIALEIMSQFKRQSLNDVRAIAADQSLPLVARLQKMLLHPILLSHERCSQSPAAVEMATSVRPNIQAHLKPILQEELMILAQVLDQGNAEGLFCIDDTMATAQTLKNMCAGFWPPFSCVTGVELIQEAVFRIVDLAYRGFRSDKQAASENYEQH